jgi:mono/diheme cytochrome c family protein
MIGRTAGDGDPRAARCSARPLALAILLGLSGCDQPQPPAHLRIAGGDAERGRALIQRYECGSCHRIDGVRGAKGVVGPPLTDYAQRVLLAGIVPNAPRTLVPWLMNPPAFDPRTGMPNLGITEAEAKDIATYLYTLGADGVLIWPGTEMPLREQ